MGYHMRYLIENDRTINLDLVESALKCIDAGYNLAARNEEKEFADLMLGPDVYGEIEIGRRGSGLMDEELDELAAEVADVRDGRVERVQSLLTAARAMVVVRVLSQGRESEATLDRIAPLWDWLFKEYRGLLQADGEGYYDVNGEVLRIE